MSGEPSPRPQGHVERVLALRAVPGLGKVPPLDLAALADIAVERVFPQGSLLLPPRTEVRSIHLVRSGTVLSRGRGGTRRSSEGEVVGLIPALARAPEGLHVVAETEARTFEMNRDHLEEVLEESFSVLLAALRGTMRAVLETRLSLPVDAGFSSPIVGDGVRSDPELGLVERVLFLRRLLTYGRARVEALAELARAMTEVRAPAGTEFFALGAPAPHALLVWSGVVAGESARGQTFRFGPESVVGGIDSIAGEPRWYRAVAETEVVALRSDTAHLIDVIEDHPDMGLDMLRSAARIQLELQAELPAPAEPASGLRPAR